MNEEAVVVNLFFTFRVFLVTGFLFIYPRIMRKGLVFGTYLGEERAGSTEVRTLRRSWDRGCLLVLLLSLAVGWTISLSGYPITGNLTATAVVISSAVALYFWMHFKARKLAPPAAARQAQVSAASLDVDAPRGEGFAMFSLVICLLTGIATMVYGTSRYEAMPAQIPTFANMFDYGEELQGKSLLAVLLLPSFNLVFSPFFALMALLTARAKRSLRGGKGGRSVEAQRAFRTTMTRILSGWALAVCLFVTVVSVAMIRVNLGVAEGLDGNIVWVAGAVVLYALVSLFLIMRHHGQGGALREHGSVDAPLTGGLADNAHWVWGMIYVDREDPSLMVENRFGIGYTLNLGNRLALTILASFLVLSLGLMGLVVMQAMG